MPVGPTALLVGDENQAPAADSGPPPPPPQSTRPSHRPDLYTTVVLHVPMPMAGEQAAMYHVYEGLRNVR